jgi:hypothetical protein
VITAAWSLAGGARWDNEDETRQPPLAVDAAAHSARLPAAWESARFTTETVDEFLDVLKLYYRYRYRLPGFGRH